MCGKSESLEFIKVVARSELFRPSVPNGWSLVDKRLFCPEHTVSLKVVTGTKKPVVLPARGDY